MNECQGRGRITRQGEHIATVEYSVQSEPDSLSNSICGDVEIVDGMKSLSPNDQFTLHMEGSLELDFQIEQVTDQSIGKYHLKGVGVFRKAS